MYGCQTCGGVWLDNVGSMQAASGEIGELPRWTAAALAEQVKPAKKEHPGARDAYRQPAARAKDARLLGACPACAKPLQRVYVAAADVTLDVCASHGTWFDAHELTRVVSQADIAKMDREPIVARPRGAIETLAAWKDGDLDVNDVLKAAALASLHTHPRGRY